MLAEKHRQRRVSVTNEFLSRAITGNEAWIFCYDPQTKQHSCHWKIRKNRWQFCTWSRNVRSSRDSSSGRNTDLFSRNIAGRRNPKQSHHLIINHRRNPKTHILSTTPTWTGNVESRGSKHKRAGGTKLWKKKDTFSLSQDRLTSKGCNNLSEEVNLIVKFWNSGKTDSIVGSIIYSYEVSPTFLGLPTQMRKRLNRPRHLFQKSLTATILDNPTI